MVAYNKEKMTELDFNLLKSKYSEDELREVLKRIDEDYPVQYAIGDVDFLDCKINVDERALIPRFETELLVDKLSKYMVQYGIDNGICVDVCTGSGCIAIALKKKFADMQVLAIDKSREALDLALENSQLNETDVQFIESDVLEDLSFEEKIDVLVSNPPYVSKLEYVSPNTKYEPEMALYPDGEDTVFYKRILEQSKIFMNKKSILAFEIGSTQGDIVSNYAKGCFPGAKVSLEKDYAGLDRFGFIFNGFE